MSNFEFLQDFCQIVQGGRHKQSGNDFVPFGFPAYGAGGLNGYLPSYEFDESAVILSAIGARCGKCFFVDGRWSSLANTQVIRPDLQKCDPKFLWFQLNDERRWPRVGSGQPFIKPSDVKRHGVFLPPLSEQRRIAAILDQADALRAKRREALAQLDSLTQSIFIEMFGDPVTNSKQLPTKPLNQITKFENGDRSGNYPSGDDIKDHGVLFLSTKNITDGRLDLTKPVYISDEKFKSLSRGKALSNDLIITLRGTLGSCCIFDTFHKTAFINAQMMIVRPLPECDSTYLHALLTSKQAQERFDHIGRGAAVPQLTAAQMASLQIPVPPLADQQEFARRKKALDENKGKQETALAQLEALFASLQHRAFRGEL